jgi:plasmid stabilization system protein ParE
VKLEILDEAEEDIDSAYSFFSNLASDYANHFQSCLSEDLEKLQTNYGWHSEHHGCHRALSKKFQTSIYYLVRTDHLLIVAILDQRFSPSHIRNILNERRPNP